MPQHEIATGNYVVDAILRDDDQPLAIAQSPDQFAQLNSFYKRFVAPDSVAFDVPGSGLQDYAAERLTMVGSSGSLISVRTHANFAERTVDESLKHSMVIGHLDDPCLALVTTAIYQQFRSGGVDKEIYTSNTTQERNLWPVDDGANEASLRRRQIIQYALARATQATITVANGLSLYKRSDGLHEILKPMEQVRRNVRVLIDAEMGHVDIPLESSHFIESQERVNKVANG